ncbi:MAG: protein translocase subunit SecF [Nanoarchaeota archaeon]|nr:protein translocase subunit SecF [Nanoarchaeota archaeon]
MAEEVVQVSKRNWHDKYYKLMLIIPLILVLGSLMYIGVNYSQTGDFFKKDISLTGGTSITVYDENISLIDLERYLSESLPDLSTKRLYEFGTNKQIAVVIETTLGPEEAKEVLEGYLNYGLIEGENSDITFTGSVLSESFFSQLLVAILIAFLFMSIVVFIIFKKFLPSFAVIFSAFANILMTLAVVDMLGMKMSAAGIVSFLMIIGYSIDTDILLTTRILKRHEGSLNERIFGAFKTGMTMTLTSFFALLGALIFVQSFSGVLTQIFTILVIGLGFDMINTWVTNVSVLKWYVEKKSGSERQ